MNRILIPISLFLLQLCELLHGQDAQTVRVEEIKPTWISSLLIPPPPPPPPPPPLKKELWVKARFSIAEVKVNCVESHDWTTFARLAIRSLSDRRFSALRVAIQMLDERDKVIETVTFFDESTVPPKQRIELSAACNSCKGARKKARIVLAEARLE